MVTEGHNHGQREDCQQKYKVEMDIELNEIRVEMGRLALKMQQESRVRWRYEWPIKQRENWPIQ